MGRKRQMLVPVDFSDPSINALKYAIEISKLYDANLMLLHAYRLIKPQELPNLDEKSLKNELSKQVENKFHSLVNNYLDPAVTSYSAHVGFPNDVIETFISSNHIDLIVMGTTGDGQNSVFFGSTPISVVNSIDQPILLIPPKVSYKKWNNVFSNSNKDVSTRIQKSVPDILNDKNIYIKEEILEDNQLEKVLFEDKKIDLLAINNKDFKRFERNLESGSQTPKNKTIPIPILVHC